jgi:hypothetical protein
MGAEVDRSQIEFDTSTAAGMMLHIEIPDLSLTD